MATYDFVPMTGDYAEAIAEWHYDGVYSFYDLASDPEDFAEFMDSANWHSYRAVLDGQDHLVGFFSYTVNEAALTIGLGMRPDLTGMGLGEEFIRAGIDFGTRQYAVNELRLAVATFNVRAIKTYEKVGFVRTETFTQRTNGGDYEFIRMSKQLK